MPQVDVPQSVFVNGGKYSYTVASSHRNGNVQQKSQWSIGLKEETDCFKRTMGNGWLEDPAIAWGMAPRSPHGMEIIGRDKFVADLRIAKFVGKGGNWHGYPENHSRGPKHRPTEKILRDWMAQGHLDKSKLAKIKSGKRCNL